MAISIPIYIRNPFICFYIFIKSSKIPVFKIPFLAKMTSRLRGPSAVKDTPRAASFAKDHFHRSEPEVHSGRSCKNGGRGNRYHFGMSKQHDNKVERNGGRENSQETEEDNTDLLYRKSREHFASWDIKDIVDDTRKSKRQDLEDTRLTNGKFRSEPVDAKGMDKSQQEYRDKGYVGFLPRENQQTGESVEREVNGSHRSRKKESWEEEVEPRGRGRTSKIDDKSNANSNDAIDERDILLKEIENLAVDGSQSPDRRIQAMIERLKAREESKLRSRREQRSVSPEKETHGKTRSSGRNDLRSPVTDCSLDNRSNDRSRKPKDDREEERRPSESKLHGKSDRDEETASRRDRLTDRRSRSIERREDEDRKPRRDDSLRKRNDVYSIEKNYRGRSKEDEGDQLRSRDSSKRRSYTYEGSPEEFEVKIQKYDRALLEPRRDLDKSSPKRSSPREPNLIGKESLKDYDREPITKKSSFRAESKRATSKDRSETSLTRKASFKDDDTHKRHVTKNQHETSVRYFGKDQDDSFRKDSNVADGKNAFRTRDSEFSRTFLKERQDDVRKLSPKEHVAGVSRIVLKNFDDESSRKNSFRNANEDSGRKDSFKEKNVEFGASSYKDRKNDSERRKNMYENEEFGRTNYRDYENNVDRKIANDRYIEFGKVSFNTQEDNLRVSSPYKERNDDEVVRTSSFEEHDAFSKRPTSSRSRNRDALEEKSDRRHPRSLTPPKKDEPELSRVDNAKDSKNFCAKSWYESNRLFSAKYLRDHSRLRNPPEVGRLDIVDVSAERGFSTEKNPDEDNLQLETRDRIVDSSGESSRFSTRERNGATIIKIRSEDPGGIVERRRRRRPAQEACVVRRGRYEDDDSDEDEEEDRRRRTRRDGGILPGRGGGDAGGATPSRTIWSYREGVWHFHESVAFDRSFMVQKREAIFINRWRR